MKVPKYYLVKNQIIELTAGLEPGTAVPAERELAERFGTSRTTVRQAIAELVADGRLERAQGRGTFVASPKMLLLPQVSFSSNAMSQGWRPGRVVVSARCEGASGVVREKLRLEEGEQVTRFEVLRTVDGEPLAHETVHLPGDLTELSERLEAQDSLYRMLGADYDMGIREVEDVVETIPCDPVRADLLGVSTGQPLLLVHRTGFGEGGRPVEWTESAFRGDRYRFVSRRTL
ncbi:GntR family transcriptional regulator [Corynebacterium kalidii]|uniref:GntR family transcriptional regulator n=1 Tax=Corynebacterium kalidii TaxID=2931982 RepID=A0A9X1WP73_9CORY|nr:GntR family transcriptional regulator [Corynebacterium kalidii]MCJ7858721.1 GntR family transcriptional regulator [Corynebacterium kalidii]